MNEEEELINKKIENEEFISAILSGPLLKGDLIAKKIEIRSLIIKNQKSYQISKQIKDKVFHENISQKELIENLLNKFIVNYKQSILRFQDCEYQILTNKKGMRTFLKRKLVKSEIPLFSHNRKKQYLLNEGEKIPFLIELGVMSSDGKVIYKKSDKFKQLNRFLEMIDDILPFLQKNQKLHIVDFGSGKAYLTFALYHYLHEIKNLDLEMIGLDLKEDVVDFCNKIAKKLQFKGLKFLTQDIRDYQTDLKIDMVVSLHACNTATDAALEKAIEWGADVILAVPCCQHELYSQVKNETLNPLLKHGILKERFASLLTDALRAEILELKGYQTDIIEFIDLEHTPKNLMIRGIKRKNLNKSLDSYKNLKEAFNINPTLEKIL